MELLSNHTSEQYLEYSRQTSEVIKQWLDANDLYLGGKPEQIKQKLALNINAQGRSFDSVLKDIQDKFLPACVSTANQHCLAHLHPPTLVISQVAEMLIAATSQSMDSWNQSPSATHMEQELVQWLCRLCQFDETKYEAGGVFTSGGTQSNLMGALLARNKFFESKGFDVQKKGLLGAPSGVILCSSHTHFSIEKNATLLGLGQESVEQVETNKTGQMCPEKLQQKIDQIGSANVIAVVATAGTTDSGVIDSLTELGNICSKEGIWLHVDAAWGGALLLSQRYSQMLDGIHLADSITLDFHKHFFLPSSCGAFVVRDIKSFESIRHHSEYLNPQEDEQDETPNLVTYSLQTTRRFDALKLWLALELLGTETYAKLIDKCLDTAREAAQVITENDNFVLLQQPIISSVLFYFKPQDAELSASQLAQFNRQLAQELLVNNVANLATTVFEQQPCFKFTILNPNTQVSDIANILQQLTTYGVKLLNQDGEK